jgi:hypothetical protein
MDHNPIASIGDFLVAHAERDLLLARKFLEETRAKNEYFHEKAAAKIVAFYQLELTLIKQYVELKLYFPQTAMALEEQKPYLVELWAKAERERTENLVQN